LAALANKSVAVLHERDTLLAMFRPLNPSMLSLKISQYSVIFLPSNVFLRE
jgi:hypothetical protein